MSDPSEKSHPEKSHPEKSQHEKSQHFDTLALHAGLGEDAYGAVAQPIHLSTTFARDDSGELLGGHSYIRSGNPNRQALEIALARLEGGSSALSFATGLAALHALFQALDPGDHVVIPSDLYHGTSDLLRDQMVRWGLELSVVDFGGLASSQQVERLRAAWRPRTRLVLIESPSNPQLQITDIAAVAAVARENGALCAVDNTWMTPVWQRPLELGAHLVMHSCTKYFGGHSDVAGGALVMAEDDPLTERLRFIQDHGGAVPSPFDCWLLRRGLMTLGVRVRAQTLTAGQVARFLADDERVVWVAYPGLESDPGHEIAARQASGFGAMLSFRVPGGFDGAKAVASRVRLFTRATSLGGVESLVEHRALVEGPHSRTPRDLLRMSVGLEHVNDLIADLDQALG